MVKRRGHNEGSISWHAKSERWRIQISTPEGRKTTYTKTRPEAAKKLHEMQQALKQNLPIPSERLTVEQFLHDWLIQIEPTIKARTHVRYEQFIRNIVPTLGTIKLARLSGQQVDHLYAQLLKQGLSKTTVNHVHALLHVALKKAVKLGLVARNVCDLADPPPVEHTERPTWTAEQARQFLDTIVGDPLEALYVLEIYTGMREGEILALHWSNVNLKERVLSVREHLSYVRGKFEFTTPKTRRSRRDILLAEEVVEALQAHRQSQLERKMRLRDIWDDSDLVFPNGVGHPIEASNFLKRSYYPLVEKAGLPRIHFHDLRQTVSHILKKEGVSTEATAETFGHENRDITDRFYGHGAPELQEKVVETMERVLRKKPTKDSDPNSSSTL